MSNDVTNLLQSELDKYLTSKTGFSEYYPGMNTLSSELYKEQLKEILELVKDQSDTDTHSFEMYLDTIILNMHTKLKKYKKSIYFDNENIKDIQNQGCTIVFYIDAKNKMNVLLGIVKPKETI